MPNRVGFIARTIAAALERDFMHLASGRPILVVGKEMADKYQRASDRVFEFMPCLIDDAQFQAFSDFPVNKNVKHLICVGRLSPEKGHRFLLSAMALLRNKGFVCHLDIVGCGPTENALRRQAFELKLETQVVFHGFVGYGPRLFSLYKKAGAAVIPSLTEGFPQVINEALSVGLPIIATKVGGIPAFLTDEATALLVPSGDIDMLARAICRLARDSELCDRLRKMGRLLMARNTLEENRELIKKVVRNEIVSFHAQKVAMRAR